MRFTLHWLKEFLDTSANLDTVTQALTAIGLEVESVTDKAGELVAFEVAAILEAGPHPQADKLQVCKVQTRTGVIQVVCGAPNARAGMYGVLAPVDTLIPANGMKIKAAKIRGVESFGMLCSAAELGLGGDSQGIIEVVAKPEDIGKPYVAVAGLDDPVIEVAVTPNRADCLGVYGIARDLAAAGLGILKPYAVPSIASSGHSPITVTVKEERSCPLFIGRYFSQLTNGASPEWLQKRLCAIGLRPISALVDITNYLTFTFGRPLHLYDAKKLQGGLVVRKAVPGETIEALNGKTYTLTEAMPVIADAADPQAIAGVIGGMKSGCDAQTTDAFLEVALFNPTEVAQTGRKLDCITDSRYRFERYVDPGFVQDAVALASALILELCGGKASECVVVGDTEVKGHAIAFDTKRIQQLGGVDVEESKVKDILFSLGFTGKGEKYMVPSWRADITGEADMVEEILRIHGYHTIPAVPLPRPVTVPSLSGADHLLVKAKRLLAMRGMQEAITWSFMQKDKAKWFGANDEGLTLQNPISSELDTMRPSILPHLLDAAKRNTDRDYADMAFFEAGPVFFHASPEGKKTVLAGVRTGWHTVKNSFSPAREADVFDIKADVLAVLGTLGVPVQSLRTTREVPSWFHPGKAGAFLLGKQCLAVWGELHPGLLKHWGLDQSVAGFEIFMDVLPLRRKKNTQKAPYQVSDFQGSSRDFAFIVDQSVTAAAIMDAVAGANPGLIRHVQLFDVYQGKGIEEGKKSIAISLRIVPTDRTLTDKELEEVSQQVVAQVGKQCGGVLRG